MEHSDKLVCIIDSAGIFSKFIRLFLQRVLGTNSISNINISELTEEKLASFKNHNVNFSYDDTFIGIIKKQSLLTKILSENIVSQSRGKKKEHKNTTIFINFLNVFPTEVNENLSEICDFIEVKGTFDSTADELYTR